MPKNQFEISCLLWFSCHTVCHFPSSLPYKCHMCSERTSWLHGPDQYKECPVTKLLLVLPLILWRCCFHAGHLSCFMKMCSNFKRNTKERRICVYCTYILVCNAVGGSEEHIVFNLIFTENRLLSYNISRTQFSLPLLF